MPPEDPRQTFTTTEQLAAAFDGDREFVRDLAALFLERTPALIDELREFMRSGDLVAASRTSHVLKGMIGYFQKGSAYEAAAHLELLPAGEPETWAATLEALDSGVRAISDHLSAEVVHG